MFEQFARLEGVVEKLGRINILFDCVNAHFSVDLSQNNNNLVEQYDDFMGIIEIMQTILFEQYKELFQITNNLYDKYEELEDTNEHNN